MSCSDEVMVVTETASSEDAVFEATDYVYTLRTLDHMLKEQKAEMACLSIVLDSGKTKQTPVNPSYLDVQRFLLRQLTAISVLPLDHPVRTRYISHSYYIYALEHLLI